MLEQTIVIVGGILFFCTACVFGANDVALAWGPSIGAGVVRYQVAAPLSVVFAALGVILFGARTVPLYGGFVKHWQDLLDFPEMIQEGLVWPTAVIIGWQLLSLYFRIPVVQNLGFASAILGTLVVYPGSHFIDWGTMSSTRPYLSGLGPIYLSPFIAILLTIVFVAAIFLPMRSMLFRSEDPFHTMLWAVPSIGGVTAIINVCYILFALSSPAGWALNTLSPQGVVVVLCAVAIFGCITTWVSIPEIMRNARFTARIADPIQRANRLGLDDEVLYTLNSQPPANGFKAWLVSCYLDLFDRDIVALIRREEAVLSMHNSGEEFERAAEDCLARMQTWTCALLSMGHGAATFNSAVTCFAIMLNFGKTYSVTASSPIPLHLRIVGGVAVALGVVVGGWLLVPVSGIQIAKMSPFRSYVVTTASALTASVAVSLGLTGGATTYINLAAVVAVGMIEGISHVRWPKVGQIVGWWILTFIAIFAVTALLFFQGSLQPAVENLNELQVTNSSMTAMVQQLRVMGVSSAHLQETQANLHQLTELVQAMGAIFEAAVQQAVNNFEAVQSTCNNTTLH